MAETIREYTPIANAVGNRAQFDVTLPPYVDVNQIGVDLRQTDKLCTLGGINMVRVLSDSTGEVSSYTPNIVGMGKNGEALAGKRGTSTQVPDFTTDNSLHNPGSATVPHCFAWVDTMITLNTAETNQRIKNEPQWTKGVRDPEAWAHHIDQAVKRGIKQTGIKHLSLGLNSYNWARFCFSYGYLISTDLLHKVPFDVSVINLLGFSAAMSAIRHLQSKLSEREYRFSMLDGPQIDRAVILALSSLKTPLVKTIDNA